MRLHVDSFSFLFWLFDQSESELGSETQIEEMTPHDLRISAVFPFVKRLQLLDEAKRVLELLEDWKQKCGSAGG